MNRRGFTLIELLTVIAVISILAGLLLGPLSRAKERARRTTCTSNMHQIYITMTYYSQDHNGEVPIGYRGGRKQWDTMFYSGTVNKFVTFGRLYTENMIDQPKVYYCPSERATSQSYNTTDNPWPPGKTGINLQCGYASNPLVDWGTSDEPPVWPKLDDLGRIAFLADGVGLPDRVDSRHIVGVNMMRTDGSAAWVHRDLFNTDLSKCTTLDAANNGYQDNIWAIFNKQ